MQVMLLGFVLLGRSLEERARLRASSDMNELLVSSSFNIQGIMPIDIVKYGNNSYLFVFPVFYIGFP